MTPVSHEVREAHHLSRRDARRIAVRAQLLDQPRPTDLFEVVRRLTLLQVDPIKPAATRRWGYYALPVLYGDRLVGKLDAKADHKDGVLRVFALHEDEPFTPAMSKAVQAEIDDLARWLRLELEWVDP